MNIITLQGEQFHLLTKEDIQKIIKLIYELTSILDLDHSFLVEADDLNHSDADDDEDDTDNINDAPDLAAAFRNYLNNRNNFFKYKNAVVEKTNIPGWYRIKAGSYIVIEESKTCPAVAHRIREKFIKNGYIDEVSGQVLKDINFKASKSALLAVICGYSINGKDVVPF